MKLKEEFEAEFGVKCEADNDGEIFLRKLAEGWSSEEFLKRVPCSFAGVWIDGSGLRVVRNRKRPLWRLKLGCAMFYASTQDVFRRAGKAGAEELNPFKEY